ncbi:MAG: NAD-dependent DNA ligase LigA, partial [bacterium]
VVVNVNDAALFRSLGVIGKTPRAVVAYKFPPEEATTVVEEVEWFVGRTGAVTPVAVVSPTWIGGTTVQHASLHNMDEIERLGLRIGDTVILVKAGDIIPKVIKVLTELRPKETKSIHPPKNCPICGHVVERRQDEVAYVCSNKSCFAQESAKILHAARAFDILGLGDKIVERFIEEGLLRKPSDIFTLKEGDIAILERFGSTSAKKLVAEIQSKKEIPLARFILAQGIRHVGEETAIDLANHFGTLADFLKVSKEGLFKVHEIGEVIAESIHEFLTDSKAREELQNYEKHGVMVRPAPRIKKDERFAGKTFVLTGSLESLTREAGKEEVRKRGGNVAESVSKKTDCVVVGADPGSKFHQAQKLGIKILDEAEFIKLLKG